MDADGYGEGVVFCGFAEALDEFRFGDWFAEFETTGCGYVIRCLESVNRCRGGL
jgi:hypothetical protein